MSLEANFMVIFCLKQEISMSKLNTQHVQNNAQVWRQSDIMMHTKPKKQTAIKQDFPAF